MRESATGRVVGLGLCGIDQLLRVEDFGLTAVRTRYRERATAPGGMVTTALAQAARLGCRSELLSMIGDDADGRWLARQLRGLGISTRRLVRSPDFPTSLAIAIVDARSGERRFLLPDRRELERTAPDFDLAPIRRGALLLVDGHFGANALRAVRRARERGVPVIGDFADARPPVRRLLRAVDYPVVPLEFVRAWGAGGPAETLRALQRRYGGTPVVTLGARGSLALIDGRLLRIPAPRVRVRDTTGAGDVFHGAFAAGLARGLDVAEALRLATRAAALSCTALGGSGRLARWPEVARPGAPA